MKTSKVKLRYKDRDTLFKKEFSELKIKVALNWFEIIALVIISFIGSLKAIFYFEMASVVTNITISLIITTLVTVLFCWIRKYQLKITRFDKEHIYKKISADLLDKYESSN